MDIQPPHNHHHVLALVCKACAFCSRQCACGSGTMWPGCDIPRCWFMCWPLFNVFVFFCRQFAMVFEALWSGCVNHLPPTLQNAINSVQRWSPAAKQAQLDKLLPRLNTSVEAAGELFQFLQKQLRFFGTGIIPPDHKYWLAKWCQDQGPVSNPASVDFAHWPHWWKDKQCCVVLKPTGTNLFTFTKQNGKGYCQLYLGTCSNRMPVRALVHTIMCWYKWGTPPPGTQLVQHTCDNSYCNNPEHQFYGTAMSNRQHHLMLHPPKGVTDSNHTVAHKGGLRLKGVIHKLLALEGFAISYNTFKSRVSS